jgi:hypothetical protein
VTIEPLAEYDRLLISNHRMTQLVWTAPTVEHNRKNDRDRLQQPWSMSIHDSHRSHRTRVCRPAGLHETHRGVNHSASRAVTARTSLMLGDEAEHLAVPLDGPHRPSWSVSWGKEGIRQNLFRPATMQPHTFCIENAGIARD